MLAVVLMGNLMLPFIWAQNGKQANVTIGMVVNIALIESDLTWLVQRRPSEMFLESILRKIALMLL